MLNADNYRQDPVQIPARLNVIYILIDSIIYSIIKLIFEICLRILFMWLDKGTL